MLSDCVGSAKHHKFKFVQHNDTGDRGGFFPAVVHWLYRSHHGSVWEYYCWCTLHELSKWISTALHQLLKTTKNLFPSETLQAMTDTPTGAVAVGDGLISVACKKQPLKIGKYFKKYKGSVASRPLFYYLNGTLARQLGYDNIVWPQLNHWEIEQRTHPQVLHIRFSVRRKHNKLCFSGSTALIIFR